MSETKTQGRIFWGLLLIVLGVFFLLDQMGTLHFGRLVGRYWPVIFILIGVSILLDKNIKNTGSGVFFILFGTFFLLLRLRIFDRSLWHFVWPLAIIGVGFWILLRPVFRPDRKNGGDLAADDLKMNQVFSGGSRRVESQNFRGGKADVVFGSAEIDLRAAKLADGRAELELSVVFGRIEVIVPRDWQVALEGSPVLGSIESRKAPAAGTESAGTLAIRGSAVFGAIEVRD
jgi:predicted membrane protein